MREHIDFVRRRQEIRRRAPARPQIILCTTHALGIGFASESDCRAVGDAPSLAPLGRLNFVIGPTRPDIEPYIISSQPGNFIIRCMILLHRINGETHTARDSSKAKQIQQLPPRRIRIRRGVASASTPAKKHQSSCARSGTRNEPITLAPSIASE